MLGLRRGIVTLSPHNEDWLRLGAEACRKVRTACGDPPIVVEHVGSTSVPGLIAKPILDLALGLPTQETIHAVIPALTQAGFIYRGEGEGSGGFLFVWESEPEVRTIHAHAVLHPSSHWDDYVVFRDILRANPTIRQEYEALKTKNAERFSTSRKQYTAAKVKFIQSVLSHSDRLNT